MGRIFSVFYFYVLSVVSFVVVVFSLWSKKYLPSLFQFFVPTCGMDPSSDFP